MNISKKELEKILERSVAEGVRKYMKETKHNRYADTFKLMRDYRAAYYSVSVTDKEDRQAEKLQEEATIKANRARTQVAVTKITEALEIIKNKREDNGRGLEFEAFKLYFIDGRTYQKIAELLNVGEATPRRWVTSVVQELSVMLWGYNEECL